MAKEVDEWLKTVNYDIEEWKKSKYYNMKNIGPNSPEKKGKGSISKMRNFYVVQHKTQYFGTYSTEELAEEVRQWCIEHNWDYDEWKKSKYYTLSADHRQISKNYWREEKPTMNKKNQADIQGFLGIQRIKNGLLKSLSTINKLVRVFIQRVRLLNLESN